MPTLLCVAAKCALPLPPCALLYPIHCTLVNCQDFIR